MPSKFGHPFTIKGAKHFCRPVVGAAPAGPTSFRDLIELRRSVSSTLAETQPDFEPFRVEALREADRQLFLAISNYRRSKDLLMGSSASWSWVTMYYSSFHAAAAILGCLGVSIDPKSYGGVLVDVAKETPGGQILHIRDCPRDGPTTQGGSHRLFWDLFYHYLSHFKTTLPTSLRGAAEPVNKIRTWQIEKRNLVSYDTFAAFEVCSRLKRSFNSSRFPGSLDTEFRDQHNATVAMIDAALWIAQEVGLNTDVLDTFASVGSRRQRLEAAIQRVRPPFPVGRPLFLRTIPNQSGRSIYV